MATRKISALKFVGTVSLGLMTGASYTLSAFTVPSLLELPSASAAAKSFRSVTATSARHLGALTSISGTAFFLAFALSPRGLKHPYLLYTSALCFGTRLAAVVTPALLGADDPSSSSPSASAAGKRAALAQARKERQDARRMESSYEVLGESSIGGGSSAGSHHNSSGDEQEQDREAEEEINGEEVRAEVDAFVKNQMVQTAIAGLGFMMAVVGIWGDGTLSVGL